MTNAIAEAVRVLNRALATDRDAISELLTHYVPANDELLADPTVQAVEVGEEGFDSPSVGALGLINGLFGVAQCGWGHIVAYRAPPGYLDPSPEILPILGFGRLDHSRCSEGEHVWNPHEVKGAE